jgi:2-dehydro-3-deoxyglucarate aldolase
VEAIDGILAVPGVDAAFVGPYDLSASMGITAQFEHPDYAAAVEEILSACGRHNVAPGIHVVPPDPGEVARRAGEGFRMIAYSLDITMLGRACRDGLAESRRLAGTVR